MRVPRRKKRTADIGVFAVGHHTYWNQFDGLLETDSRVRVGELSLACSSAGPGKGDAGIVTIRPEDVVPVESKGKSVGKNGLRVRIDELEFLGAFWRAWLVNPKLGEDGLKANFSINAARRLDLAEGKEVRIVLPPERLRVFAAAGR